LSSLFLLLIRLLCLPIAIVFQVVVILVLDPSFSCSFFAAFRPLYFPSSLFNCFLSPSLVSVPFSSSFILTQCSFVFRPGRDDSNVVVIVVVVVRFNLQRLHQLHGRISVVTDRLAALPDTFLAPYYLFSSFSLAAQSSYHYHYQPPLIVILVLVNFNGFRGVIASIGKGESRQLSSSFVLLRNGAFPCRSAALVLGIGGSGVV
jgi:hypothetical protein